MLYSAILLTASAGIAFGRMDPRSNPPRNSHVLDWHVQQLQQCRRDLHVATSQQWQHSEPWQQPGRQERATQRQLEFTMSPTTSPEPYNPPFTSEEDFYSDEFQESLPLGHITEITETAVTFVASNKTENNVNLTDWTERGRLTHVAQLSPEFNPSNHSLFLGSRHSENSIQPSPGLIHTVLTAYKDHHSLVLTPDDIWTAILVQFSRYVNANPEQLRNRFVFHEGKKTLSFRLDSFAGSNGGGRQLTDREWELAYNSITSQLKEASNPSLSRFMENNFTTTSPRTRLVSGLTFMSTMQHYFNYEFTILCGIPRITLLGTEDDWLQIAERLKYLQRFGNIPSKWADLLAPIINKFIDAKRRDVDGEFWGNIVKIQKNSVCGGSKTEDVLDGWLAAFAVFDGKGVWRGDKGSDWEWPRINMKYVSSGVVTVPIKLTTRNYNGQMTTQEATIFAGHMGHEISADRKTLTPYSGWAVAAAITPSRPERNVARVNGRRSARHNNVG